jgi:hypothetical protein
MALPIAILEAISTATSVSELLDLLLRILNLQSKDVERLEKKWDIKQHADFQSAVQLLRLARMDANDVSLVDLDLLKNGLSELLKSWNYYTDLHRKGVLDQTVELELVYVISGWLIAKSYLKIQECEGRQELIEDAVRYYLRVMEFVQERIFYFKNPPPPQPVLFFHEIDGEIIKFVSTGNPATRFFRSLVLVAIMAIWFVSVPYLVVDILIRVFGNAVHGRSKINSLILEKLNEMYIKSLIEVAPYLDEGTLQKVFSAQSPRKVLLP